MKITTIDWVDIQAKLLITEHQKIREHNDKPLNIANENFIKNNGSTKRVYSLEDLVPECIDVFWDKLYQVLASVEPIKIDDSYSPLETMRNIPEVIKTPYGNLSKANFRAIIRILNFVPRSYTLPGRAADHPQWSQLVPLWLAAYKHYKNINYNSWIRDSGIQHMIGEDLWEEIKEIPEDFVMDVSRIKELRNKALTNKMGTAKLTSPVRKSFNMTDTWKIKLNSKVGAMYLQIWLANVQLRHPDMILDPIDWDRVPEAYDAILETVNASYVTKPVNKKYDLPF